MNRSPGRAGRSSSTTYRNSSAASGALCHPLSSTESLGRLINELLREQGDQFDALYIPFKSHFCGKWIEHSGWWPGYTMPRVLRRGCFEFRRQLHGGVDVRGRTRFLPSDPNLAIAHFSYRSVEHYLEKFNRYTSTEADQLVDMGTQFHWETGIRQMVRDWWLYYERNQGHLDGQHGWILSWLAGQYRWFSHAKILDLRGSESEGGQPAGLDQVLSTMRDELARLRRDAPVVPLGVVFRSPIWDPSGYADEGRFILRAMSRGPRWLSAEEIRWSDARCEIATEDTALLKTLGRVERQGASRIAGSRNPAK